MNNSYIEVDEMKLADTSLLLYRLYAVGGRDGSSCLRSVECYDPHTNKWMLCSPMAKRRGGVGVAACNGFMYAVGGHDAPASNPASSRFDCVERYGHFNLTALLNSFQ